MHIIITYSLPTVYLFLYLKLPPFHHKSFTLVAIICIRILACDLLSYFYSLSVLIFQPVVRGFRPQHYSGRSGNFVFYIFLFWSLTSYVFIWCQLSFKNVLVKNEFLICKNMSTLYIMIEFIWQKLNLKYQSQHKLSCYIKLLTQIWHIRQNKVEDEKLCWTSRSVVASSYSLELR